MENSAISPFVDEDEFDEDDEWREAVERLIHERQASAAINRRSYRINDISIEFPYEAYESQHLMMKCMTSALKKSENCLLESPTGTGKTAALLCGLLAWQKEAEEKGRREEIWPWEIDEATVRAGCTCGFNKLEDPKKEFEIRQKSISRTYGNPDIILERYGVSYDLEIQENTNEPSTSTECQSPKKRRVLVRRLNASPDESRDQSELCRYCIRTNYQESSVPIIYYATRTVSQVQQVAKELKSTSYSNGVKMTILASRKVTCLNLDVKNSSNVNDKCQKLRKNYWRYRRSEIGNENESTQGTQDNSRKICGRYANTSEEMYKNRNISCEESIAWDIEDLNLYSRRNLGCSYYGTRILKKDAKIVFCTYNHLLNGGIRNAMDIDLTNSVLVFDEAHNIEDICREISSVIIRNNHIVEKIIPELERSLTENVTEIPLGLSPILNSLLNFFRKLNSWFDSQSKLIKFDYERNSDEYKEFPDEELLRELATIGFTKENVIKYNSDLEILAQNAKTKKRTDNSDESAEEEDRNKFKFKSSVIKYMTSLFWKFYHIFGEGKDQTLVEHFRAAFVKTVTSRTTNLQGARVYTFDNEFRYICLNPAIAFEPLKKRAHSIIVASGTLSPLHSFESELDTPFPNKLSAPHVIKSSNVFSSVVAHGPSGVELCYLKKEQGKLNNQLELGMCILNICKHVPHGVLVFLPSYTWMEQLKRTWATSSESAPILSQIREIKKVFFEEKDKERFLRDMKDYTETISSNDTNGCVLFAIFRGKVSEGVDFKDNQARAVVTVGIPFTSQNNPNIAFKMAYNDRGTSRRLLPGKTWYQTQAFRALNQAFGRCVRHQNDWGSLIIIESRMTLPYNKSKLSSWVATKLQDYYDFKEMENSLKEFIQFKQNEDHFDDNEEDLSPGVAEQASSSSFIRASTVSSDNHSYASTQIIQSSTQSVDDQASGSADAPTQIIKMNHGIQSIRSDDNSEFQSPRSEVAQRLQQSVQLTSPVPRRTLQF